MPFSVRFYERFARVAFADSQTPELDYNLGLYLISIAIYSPKIQFSYSQSLIAACAVHCALRIRSNKWIWSEYLHKNATCGKYSEESLKECSYEIIKRYVGLQCRREKKLVDRLWIL